MHILAQRDLLSDDFVVAFVTIAVYAVCYAYEQGIAKYYGIPLISCRLKRLFNNRPYKINW